MMESTTRRNERSRRWIRPRLALFVASIACVIGVNHAAADVPIRISVKFIVDANGNRPAMGGFSTTADVNAETDAGNDILRDMISEHRMLVTEIIDLPTSLSAYSTIAVSGTNRNLIRGIAVGSPTLWSWRTNAVNVYVTGGTGSANSAFPPNNDIILFGQNCGNSPSCLLHELGHSLNLFHTHASDGCSDTLSDDSSWTIKDQMALANYLVPYASLTSGQKNLVDQTWSNFMSYHTSPPQLRYSPCQKDRASVQAYSDVGWLLAKVPVYVGSCSFFCNGSFLAPFPSIQHALNGGGLSGRVIVLDDVDTIMTQSAINFGVEINTRQGTSHIDQGVLNYELPANVDPNSDAEVVSSVRAAQDDATASRNTRIQANKDERAAAAQADRDAIRANAAAQERSLRDNAMKSLMKAEKKASGNERLAIQLEIAQRSRQRGEFAQCIDYYNRVAANTDQFHLNEKALMHAQQCQDERDAQQSRAASGTP